MTELLKEVKQKEPEPQTIEQTIMAFQAVFSGVEKKRKNTFTDSLYANLDDVWNAIKPHLLNLEISVIQPLVIQLDGKQVLKTIIKNKWGASIESTMELLLEKQTPQGLGSALTYARRYSLCGLLGIVETEDDDANSLERVSEPKIADRQLGQIYDLIAATSSEESKISEFIEQKFNKQDLSELNYSQASVIISMLKSKLKNIEKVKNEPAKK